MKLCIIWYGHLFRTRTPKTQNSIPKGIVKNTDINSCGDCHRIDMTQFIDHFKNGIPHDQLWEPLKKTKKNIIISRDLIPGGSYICYVISDGGPTFEIYADKKRAMVNFRSSKKSHIKMWGNDEISLIETYVTPKGDFIDDMVIAQVKRAKEIYGNEITVFCMR